MEDPNPDVRGRDVGYSIDKLRYEQQERFKEDAKRQREMIDILNKINMALYAIAGLLLAIGWELRK